MKNSPWFPVFFLWLVAGMACGESSSVSSHPESVPAGDVSPVEAAQAAEMACLTRPDGICQTGLSFLQLGDPMDLALPEEMEATEAGARWLEGGGFEWLERVIQLPEGRLIVEGSFLDQRFINDSLRASCVVNRMRIESPSFSAAGGIGVGSTLAELAEAYAGSDVGLIPIPDYDLLDVQPDTSHIHFLIPLPATLPDSLSLESLDPAAPVTAIVVM
ncbi:MAG: hypothetical protein D6722_04525 [Bacteroidetes bacterium]|nr:MAG: hypothetical protein D6722_04525 [Bacteroidota bacterium]